MISTVISTIIDALKAAGLAAVDAPGAEYVATNRSASRFVAVHETDADYTVTDTTDVVTARYTVSIDIAAQGASATAWARADLETTLAVLASIALELVVTGWERLSEESITDASYTLSCDVTETIQL